MKRDAIDFEKDRVSALFRKLLIPTLLGTISMSAVTAVDGIFVGHGVGADEAASTPEEPASEQLNLFEEE